MFVFDIVSDNHSIKQLCSSVQETAGIVGTNYIIFYFPGQLFSFMLNIKINYGLLLHSD